MNRWIVGVGILVLVVLGFLFISNMTGNVITGMVVGGEAEVVESEVFRISDFGNEGDKEVIDDGEGRSG